MSNATLVYFDRISEDDNTTRIFQMLEPKRDTIWVDSFENGIATIRPMYGYSIKFFAEVVAGCFAEDSDFVSELFWAFGCDKDTDFKGIKFECNGVTLLVTKENSDADKIYDELQKEMEADAEKAQLELEAYMKTPEYRAQRVKELKLALRREALAKDVIAIDESTELQFKDEEAARIWEQWVEDTSKEPYMLHVITYARRWGKYMQHLMEKHNKTINDIADNASHVSNINGITGFMHSCAVYMLAQCWKYGEELRKWHNKEWGEEDTDGVVIPEVLTIAS